MIKTDKAVKEQKDNRKIRERCEHGRAYFKT